MVGDIKQCVDLKAILVLLIDNNMDQMLAVINTGLGGSLARILVHHNICVCQRINLFLRGWFKLIAKKHSLCHHVDFDSKHPTLFFGRCSLQAKVPTCELHGEFHFDLMMNE